MSQFAVIPPPINTVRKAVFARLQTSPSTSAFTLLREGQTAAFPYIAVSAAYKGSGGTDPEIGVNVIVQVEAYALASQGGTHKVTEMIEGVYSALSTAVVISPYRPLTIMVEEDTLNSNLVIDPTNEIYAQRLVRFRFLITT
jgi:hypothetical protein